MTTAELSAPETTAPAPPRGWTKSALRDLLYSAAICGWGVAAFTIGVTGLSVTVTLLPLVVGIFVWLGFVHVLRWTTYVDRRLAGWQRDERVPAVYRRPAAPGLMPHLRTLTSDPQTWRDLGWLAVTSVVGFAGGLVVLTAAGLAMAYVSMPIWYWAVSDPRTEYGVTNLGLVTVDTLGEAACASVLGFALIPLVLLAGRWCARAHAALAARVLGPSSKAASAEPGGRDA